MRRLLVLGLVVIVIFHGIPAYAFEARPEQRIDRGSVERTAPAAEVSGGTGGISVTSTADCQGCYAWSSLGWDSGIFNVKTRAKTRNYADEIIDRQEAHLALIEGDACYQGDYLWTGGTGDEYNIEDGSLVDSGWHWGGHSTYTNANGHNWYDDGGHWAVNGPADICREL